MSATVSKKKTTSTTLDSLPSAQKKVAYIQHVANIYGPQVHSRELATNDNSRLKSQRSSSRNKKKGMHDYAGTSEPYNNKINLIHKNASRKSLQEARPKSVGSSHDMMKKNGISKVNVSAHQLKQTKESSSVEIYNNSSNHHVSNGKPSRQGGYDSGSAAAAMDRAYAYQKVQRKTYNQGMIHKAVKKLAPFVRDHAMKVYGVRYKGTGLTSVPSGVDGNLSIEDGRPSNLHDYARTGGSIDLHHQADPNHVTQAFKFEVQPCHLQSERKLRSSQNNLRVQSLSRIYNNKLQSSQLLQPREGNTSGPFEEMTAPHGEATTDGSSNNHIHNSILLSKSYISKTTNPNLEESLQGRALTHKKNKLRTSKKSVENLKLQFRSYQ